MFRGTVGIEFNERKGGKSPCNKDRFFGRGGGRNWGKGTKLEEFHRTGFCERSREN